MRDAIDWDGLVSWLIMAAWLALVAFLAAHDAIDAWLEGV